MTARPTSEPLLVRVDPDTRAHLLAVAQSSDRTVSQLVRYATVWWISSPDRPFLGDGAKKQNRSEFVNVRFVSDDMHQIRVAAATLGLDRGAVVREAVRAWLAAGDFTALGDPRLITDRTAHPVAV